MIVRRIRTPRLAWGSPLSHIDQVRRDMDRLVAALSGRLPGSSDSGVFPAMNITQDADNYYVRAELPGVKADEISISAVKNKLSLAGRRDTSAGIEDASYHRTEREEGSFNRSIGLPGEIDTSRISAKHSHGILTITLPKREETKPRKIAITSG
jgi:HSP20 family protein